MTRKLYMGMVALMAITPITTTRADEIEPVEVAQVSTMNNSIEFASMQAELDELRARFDQVSFGGGCDECGKAKCGDCGASCGCNCLCDIGCGGWYAGAELVLVRPHTSFGNIVEFDDAGNVQFQNPSIDYHATPRFYAGYRNCSGRGIRARYWTFDQASNIVTEDFGPFVVSSGFGLDVTALDLEITQLVCWGPAQMNFAGGVRYGKVEIDSFDLQQGEVEQLFLNNTDFEGWGPTIAAEGRLPIGCSPLALVGNLRASLLFGDTKFGSLYFEDGNIQNSNRAEARETMTNVIESQVGIEYRRCVGNGIFTAGAVLEGQYWHNGFGGGFGGVTAVGVQAIDSGFGGGGADLGFYGASFWLGYLQ